MIEVPLELLLDILFDLKMLEKLERRELPTKSAVTALMTHHIYKQPLKM